MDFRFPKDVDGWLSEAEGRALYELARGKYVLEVGSYCGRSTICLAQSARSVTSVDPHDGRGTPNPRDTWEVFNLNLAVWDPGRVVVACRETLQEYCRKECHISYDLAFIDGAHDYDSVLDDARRCKGLLKPGGLLVFHDYRRPRDPGVTAAVDHILRSGGRLLPTTLTEGGNDGDHLAVVDPSGWDPDVAPARPRGKAVLLGVPTYDGNLWMGAAQRVFAEACRGRRLYFSVSQNSLLARGFNILWCNALNARERQGVGYFAMLHADIEPEAWWLDKLIGELGATGADLISAVVPIKDDRGLTSTAIDDPVDPWRVRRRITTRELQRLPETFTAADCGHPGSALLVNTGCWVCRLDRPWAERVCFNIADRIVRRADGVFEPQVQPEDWALSRRLHELGCDVRATRKVKLAHIGGYRFPNDMPWGLDEDDLRAPCHAEAVRDRPRSGPEPEPEELLAV